MEVLGYITAKSQQEARAIAHALVEKRLIACANIVPMVESIYRWEGKVESAEESLIFIKAVDKQKERIVSVVRAMHSDQCPCVVFVELKGGNAEFLKWIRAESKP